MKHLGWTLLILSFAGTEMVTAEPWTRYQIYKKTRLCNGLDPADFNRDGLMDYVTNFEDTGSVVLVLHPGPDRAKKTWLSVLAGKFDRTDAGAEHPQPQVQ